MIPQSAAKGPYRIKVQRLSLCGVGLKQVRSAEITYVI
nr:MAG TPA: hypothetical protein [Crassvirales sp.]